MLTHSAVSPAISQHAHILSLTTKQWQQGTDGALRFRGNGRVMSCEPSSGASLSFKCGDAEAAGSSLRFKRWSGMASLGAPYSAGPPGGTSPGWLPNWASVTPGSAHCSSAQDCGQTCVFKNGKMDCNKNVAEKKSGSGSGSR